MRKHFLFIFLALILANTNQAQTRSTRIGYIDMEYILENVPDYNEAVAQLEKKAQKWKQEIEAKKLDITDLKEALKSEKALLTKELIDERETEIKFLEDEMLDYQQKRFGVDGNLIQQKTALAKPIQDQVFTAIQDIAKAQRYDFIFDKSSNLTILFTANRYDISDQVLRIISRSNKREQLTKKQLEAQEAKENKEDAIEDNPELADRQKILDDKKAARNKILEERKAQQELKKKEYEERRNAILAERKAKKNGTVSEDNTEEAQKSEETESTEKSTETEKVEKTEKQLAAEEEKARQIAEREKLFEEHRKALEERKQKILEEREATKKAREQKILENKQNNTTK